MATFCLLAQAEAAHQGVMHQPDIVAGVPKGAHGLLVGNEDAEFGITRQPLKVTGNVAPAKRGK